MSKIELSVKINDRELTEREQKFINLWIRTLEFTLENNTLDEMIERLYSWLNKDDIEKDIQT